MVKIKIAAVILFLCSSVYGIEIDPEGAAVERGMEKYQDSKFHDAIKEYESVKKYDPRLDFNKGAAWYKQGDYDQAISSFKKSLEQAKDKELIEKNLYNLGNSYFRKGDKNGAARQYAETLRQNPENAQARKNLEIIKNIQQQQTPQDQGNDQNKGQNNKKEDKIKNDSSGASQNEKQEEKREESTPEEIKKMLESGEHERIKRKKNRPEYGKESRIFW